jgi:hypothetical protein
MTGVQFDKRLHDADVMSGETDEISIIDGHEIRGVRGAAQSTTGRVDLTKGGGALSDAGPPTEKKKPKAG